MSNIVHVRGLVAVKASGEVVYPVTEPATCIRLGRRAVGSILVIDDAAECAARSLGNMEEEKNAVRAAMGAEHSGSPLSGSRPGIESGGPARNVSTRQPIAEVSAAEPSIDDARASLCPGVLAHPAHDPDVRPPSWPGYWMTR